MFPHRQSRGSFRASLGLLLMAAMICCSAQTSDAAAPPSGFPNKMQNRLVLPPAGDPRERQQDMYRPDGITRMSSQVEYRNGVSEELKYRLDGTMSDGIKRYPAAKDGTRKVKERARFAQDGKTYTSHEVYRPNGTLERRGRRLAGGVYESRFFHADGTTTERLRLYNKKNEFLSEKIYRADGTISTELSLFERELSVTLYDEHEVRHAAFTSGSLSGARGEVYGPDGVSVRMSYVMNNMVLQADYYNEDGTLVQQMLRTMGAITVDTFDAKGFYRQVWRDQRSPDGKVSPMLRRLQEWTKDRKRIRVVEMNKDGSAPETVKYANQENPSKATAKDKIAPNRLKMPEQPAVPTFTDYGPPHIYDYPTSER